MLLDASNALWIGNLNSNNVQKYTLGASNVSVVAGQANGTRGNSSNTLFEPVCSAFGSNGSLYISDRRNSRVMLWPNGASSGLLYAGTGVSGSANNQLNNPTGIIFNTTSGVLYVADAGNHRIMAYFPGNTTGTVVAGGNGAGNSNTQLSQPYCFLIDSVTNSFIIVNYGSHTIVRWVMGASSWTLLVGSPGNSGSTSTLLSSPVGAAMDPYGNLYVADTNNHRIMFFLAGQSNGTIIAGATGTAGSNAILLSNPYWIVLDSQLNFYTMDTGNSRVQKFLHY
ncbi:unnamed protein product [Adineta ricciae]|uniref:NHL repeat containing protein n=2 Tax=Adineta ricciae TaxID=249248 RepID=A0A815WT89_ADIRI|nr:unnamed protein product [Adineta ricciae]